MEDRILALEVENRKLKEQLSIASTLINNNAKAIERMIVILKELIQH